MSNSIFQPVGQSPEPTEYLKEECLRALDKAKEHHGVVFEPVSSRFLPSRVFMVYNCCAKHDTREMPRRPATRRDVMPFKKNNKLVQLGEHLSLFKFCSDCKNYGITMPMTKEFLEMKNNDIEVWGLQKHIVSCEIRLRQNKKQVFLVWRDKNKKIKKNSPKFFFTFFFLFKNTFYITYN
jgi:hypothetical protein